MIKTDIHTATVTRNGHTTTSISIKVRDSYVSCPADMTTRTRVVRSYTHTSSARHVSRHVLPLYWSQTAARYVGRYPKPTELHVVCGADRGHLTAIHWYQWNTPDGWMDSIHPSHVTSVVLHREVQHEGRHITVHNPNIHWGELESRLYAYCYRANLDLEEAISWWTTADHQRRASIYWLELRTPRGVWTWAWELPSWPPSKLQPTE